MSTLTNTFSQKRSQTRTGWDKPVSSWQTGCSGAIQGGRLPRSKLLPLHFATERKRPKPIFDRDRSLISRFMFNLGEGWQTCVLSCLQS